MQNNKVLRPSNGKSINFYLKTFIVIILSKILVKKETYKKKMEACLSLFPLYYKDKENLFYSKKYLNINVNNIACTKIMSKIARSYKNYFLKLKQMHGQGNQHFYEFSNSNFEQINGTQIENEMVSLLIRLANLWSRAGYREKTIALFQALVELNLFSPQFPGSYSLEDRLATFEPFWESGAPRFAEDDAVGWAMVARNRHSIGQNETSQCFSNPNNDEIEDKLIQEYLHAYKGCEERETGDSDLSLIHI